MCRMVAIFSAWPVDAKYELLEAPHSLWWLSQHGKRWQLPEGRGPHDDGWGLAWREYGEMKLVKRGNPAGGDPLFRDTCGAIITHMLVAHVRKASPGLKVCDENAHPFGYQGLFLAHNGDIAALPGDAGTDSERFLHYLAPRWDRTPDGLVVVLREAAQQFRHSSLTFLMTDGQRLFAYRETRDRPAYRDYYTLYKKEQAGKTVLASEPLDDSPGWQAVASGTLLMVEAPGRAEEWFV